MLLPVLHPAARLLIWCMLASALQLLSLPLVLLLGALLALAGPQVRQHAARLLRRTRILLVTLLLVFAYGLPGPSPWGLSWLPSWEGLAEAALHGSRLLVLLASLAWLLVPLGHPALMAALWFCLRPLQRLGLPMQSTVVRLCLVLEYMENMPDRQHWRAWLLQAGPDAEAGAAKFAGEVPGEVAAEAASEAAGEASPAAGVRAPVVLILPAWQRHDSLLLALTAVLLLLGVTVDGI